MQHFQGIERKRLHLVGRNRGPSVFARTSRQTSRSKQRLRIIGSMHFSVIGSGFRYSTRARTHPKRGSAYTQHRLLPGFLSEGFVAANPFFRKRHRTGIIPYLVVFGPHLIQHIAARKGPEQHVPFLIAGQRLVGQIRASHDDGGDIALVEQIALRMQISLVDARFYVGELHQLAQRIGIVEVVESGSQDPAAHTPPFQFVEDLHQHLDAAGGNEGDREVEALASSKLAFQDREHIRLRAGAVADDARGITPIGVDAGIDEARLERVGEIDCAVLNISHRLPLIRFIAVENRL